VGTFGDGGIPDKLFRGAVQSAYSRGEMTEVEMMGREIKMLEHFGTALAWGASIVWGGKQVYKEADLKAAD